MLSLTLLSSCAGVSTGISQDLLPEPEQVISRLGERAGEITTCRMEGEITIRNGPSELSGEQRITVAAPGYLRMDVSGPFDRPVATLACDGFYFTVLYHSEAKAYTGPATPEKLGRFLGLAMSPAQIYAFITGNAPLIQHTEAKVTPATRDDRAVLLLGGGSSFHNQGVEFDLGDYIIYKSWYRLRESKTETIVKYSRFDEIAGKMRPYKIELEKGRDYLKLYNDIIEPNVPVDISIFRINVPSSYQLILVE